jgi:type V secretory pathway adhesin AidA
MIVHFQQQHQGLMGRPDSIMTNQAYQYTAYDYNDPMADEHAYFDMQRSPQEYHNPISDMLPVQAKPKRKPKPFIAGGLIHQRQQQTLMNQQQRHQNFHKQLQELQQQKLRQQMEEQAQQPAYTNFAPTKIR